MDATHAIQCPVTTGCARAFAWVRGRSWREADVRRDLAVVVRPRAGRCLATRTRRSPVRMLCGKAWRWSSGDALTAFGFGFAPRD